MTAEQRRMLFRLRDEGLSVEEVARAIGMHLITVYRVLEGKLTREGHPFNWTPIRVA
jgi:DNA invertase Pin-like site-specific DNA recombinase